MMMQTATIPTPTPDPTAAPARRGPRPSPSDRATPVTTFRAAARRAVRHPPTSYRRRDRPTLLLVTVTVEGLAEPVDGERLTVVREAMGHLLPAGYSVDVPAVVAPPPATVPGPPTRTGEVANRTN